MAKARPFRAKNRPIPAIEIWHLHQDNAVWPNHAADTFQRFARAGLDQENTPARSA